MPSAESLDDQLRHLSDAIDEPGADLRAILDLLLEDLLDAVDGFLGLDVVLDMRDQVIVLDAIEPADRATARSSLRIPLCAPGSQSPGHIIFYALKPHSFDSLADQAHRIHELAGQVVLERPPPKPSPAGTGRRLAEQRTIDQAIGVLITRGHVPAEAMSSLHRDARIHGESVVMAAQRVLAGLTSGVEVTP